MIYGKIKYGSATLQYSVFQPDGKRKEAFAMVHATDAGAAFDMQLEAVNRAAEAFLSDAVAEKAEPVMVRYFLSDVANRASAVRRQMPFKCAFSAIGQPPLDGSKVALWMWLEEESPSYKHYYDAGIVSGLESSYAQTSAILEDYEKRLAGRGLNIADDCVRTWFFVRDVDVNYGGVVKGRRENFAENRLTKDTHFVASTGIEGRSEHAGNLVSMDAYAIGGLAPGQKNYLYAKAYLNSTYEYGVTFERGATVAYGDRKHLYISGTASIDHKGRVLYEGDVAKQSHRLWENIHALLAEGGSDFSDLCYAIVYVRDIADYSTVERLFRHKFPEAPMEIVLAPVCRPAWLVEMECMAISKDGDSRFRDL